MDDRTRPDDPAGPAEPSRERWEEYERRKALLDPEHYEQGCRELLEELML